jgi:hypothetical protein
VNYTRLQVNCKIFCGGEEDQRVDATIVLLLDCDEPKQMKLEKNRGGGVVVGVE